MFSLMPCARQISVMVLCEDAASQRICTICASPNCSFFIFRSPSLEETLPTQPVLNSGGRTNTPVLMDSST